VFETIYSQIGGIVTVLVVAFAFLKGDEPERLASAAFVLVTGAVMLIPGPHGEGGARWAWMGLDFLLLAVFIGLAWHSRRTWLFWAAAFQSLIVTGHVLIVADLRPPGDAFAAVNNMSNYGLLVSIAVGAFWAWQERRASGRE